MMSIDCRCFLNITQAEHDLLRPTYILKPSNMGSAIFAETNSLRIDLAPHWLNIFSTCAHLDRTLSRCKMIGSENWDCPFGVVYPRLQYMPTCESSGKTGRPFFPPAILIWDIHCPNFDLSSMAALEPLPMSQKKDDLLKHLNMDLDTYTMMAVSEAYAPHTRHR
jgi:hypothetical protein